MFFWLNSLLIDALGKDRQRQWFTFLYNDHKNEGEDSGWGWGWGVLGQEAEEERMGGGSSKWVGSRRNRG